MTQKKKLYAILPKMLFESPYIRSPLMGNGTKVQLPGTKACLHKPCRVLGTNYIPFYDAAGVLSFLLFIDSSPCSNYFLRCNFPEIPTCASPHDIGQTTYIENPRRGFFRMSIPSYGKSPPRLPIIFPLDFDVLKSQPPVSCIQMTNYSGARIDPPNSCGSFNLLSGGGGERQRQRAGIVI